MNIVVLIKLVPDLVEELTIGEGGRALDREWLRLIINEFDDHALEQAILLKESEGGTVTVVTPDVEGADDVLYAAAARGADQVTKLMGTFESNVNSHALARVFANVVVELQPDLVLTGVQANDDLDGSIGPLLAGYLGLPYVGYVAGVTANDGELTVRKEYPGGLIAELEVALPAVLGIQSAEEPPRYVAISKVRQAMQSVEINEEEAAEIDFLGGPDIGRLFQPEGGERATMIEGDEEEIADRFVEIFQELGLL